MSGTKEGLYLIGVRIFADSACTKLYIVEACGSHILKEDKPIVDEDGKILAVLRQTDAPKVLDAASGIFREFHVVPRKVHCIFDLSKAMTFLMDTAKHDMKCECLDTLILLLDCLDVIGERNKSLAKHTHYHNLVQLQLHLTDLETAPDVLDNRALNIESFYWGVGVFLENLRIIN